MPKGKEAEFLEKYFFGEKRWRRAVSEAEGVDYLLSELGVPEGAKILDVGCGVGRIAIYLAKLGYEVVGLDINKDFIRRAEEYAQGMGVDVKFVVGDMKDVHKMFKKGEFDAVISIWTTFGYFGDDGDLEVLKRFAQITKKNGGIILDLPNRDYLVWRLCDTFSYDWDEVRVIDRNIFDPSTSTLQNRTCFYKRKGKDLKLVYEYTHSIRLYSFHEIKRMMERAGWEVRGVVGSLEHLSDFHISSSNRMVVYGSKK